MSTEIYFLIIEQLDKPLSPVENLALEIFSELKNHGCHKIYKNNVKKFKLFVRGDLRKYNAVAYKTNSLSIKIGCRNHKSKLGNLIDFPDLECFLDEIGCITIDGAISRNRDQKRIDEEISKIVQKEYDTKIAMKDLEKAVAKSIMRSKKKTFTVHELSIRSSIRYSINRPEFENVFLKTNLIKDVLNEMIKSGHPIYHIKKGTFGKK